jgi:hypothetical protein
MSTFRIQGGKLLITCLSVRKVCVARGEQGPRPPGQGHYKSAPILFMLKMKGAGSTEMVHLSQTVSCNILENHTVNLLAPEFFYFFSTPCM